MSTEMQTENVPVVDESPSDMVKSLYTNYNEMSVMLQYALNKIRMLQKAVDTQSKENEKYRNKRSRVKTERSANALPSGITKPVVISDELAKFLGVALGTLVPRNEVTKGVSGFVKSNDLSDPSNKQKFVLDDRPQAKVLRALLGNPAEDVTYFNLQRYLKHHYIQDPDAVKVPKKAVSIPVEVPVVKTPVEPPTSTPKKKIMVKKKTSELTEES